MILDYALAVVTAILFVSLGVFYLHSDNAERGFALLFIGGWTPLLLANIGYYQHKAAIAEATVVELVKEAEEPETETDP